LYFVVFIDQWTEESGLRYRIVAFEDYFHPNVEDGVDSTVSDDESDRW